MVLHVFLGLRTLGIDKLFNISTLASSGNVGSNGLSDILNSNTKDFVFLESSGDLYHIMKLNHKLDRISIAIDKEIKCKGSVNGLKGFPHVHNHLLRHTVATRMREAGAYIKATAEIIGHHEEGITREKK
ncbi:MAG: tyrosine-type recombinase/integrase [Saccharofermentans sp.]|nr:tyrosine-type recombinase/integrase [Saccharofermentans sp.]